MTGAFAVQKHLHRYIENYFIWTETMKIAIIFHTDNLFSTGLRLSD